MIDPQLTSILFKYMVVLAVLLELVVLRKKVRELEAKMEKKADKRSKKNGK